eukprot:gb/GEZN01003730.1/.p1 GENE.gb/GEZN01003730.1/~~gb/GEZN01003730.1/.p1  ORF type:complete len:560 (+),score=132.44 gb/GEZN01003730.1/:377-2056(+)
MERPPEQRMLACRRHLTVLTTGPPNLGPAQTSLPQQTSKTTQRGLQSDSPDVEFSAELRAAAAEYLQQIAERATRLCCQIDMHCVGLCAGDHDGFAVPVLQHLVGRTGGALRLYKAVTEESRQDLALSLGAELGQRGTLEIHYAAGLGVLHVLGPVTALKPGPSFTDSETGEAAVCSLLMALASTKQDDNSVCLILGLKEPLPHESLVMQVVVSYTAFSQHQVIRVCTLRVRVTGNVSTLLDALDIHVTATILAKQAVLGALSSSSPASSSSGVLLPDKPSDEEWVLELLDQRAGQLVQAAKQLTLHALRASKQQQNEEEDPELAGTAGSENKNKLTQATLPRPVQQLRQLVRLLYLLRRGPLLGPASLQHTDELCTTRELFLRCGLASSLRLLSPSLLSFNSLGSLEQLPLSSLALQSNRILYLDHHTHVLIWSGRRVAGTEFDAFREACRQRAIQTTQRRLPAPEVLCVSEGSSGARWLMCRLEPSHLDVKQHQQHDQPQTEQQLQQELDMLCRSFPGLQLLEATERQDLLAKLPPSDELTFRQFWTRLESGDLDSQ